MSHKNPQSVALDRKMPWATRVSVVFDTAPRIAGQDSAVWMDRRREQEKLAFRVPLRGDHIIVDGPTGTGKTSLTLTSLKQTRTRYVMVPVVHGFDWSRLCAAALYSTRDPDVPGPSSSVGIEPGLHTLALKLESGHSSLRSQNVPRERAEWASGVDEHMFAQLLQRENASLVVDDAEEADGDLLRRLANVAKLLSTDRDSPPNAKVIFVGTGDIYARLIAAKPQLDSRVFEISLGTLPEIGRGWDFLRQGFVSLGIPHPGNDRSTSADLEGVVRAVYDAADGLPKALNELGKAICEDCRGGAVSAKRLVSIAQGQTLQNWKKCFQRASVLMAGLGAFPVARDVFRALASKGIGTIHDCDDVHAALDGALGFDQVEIGLDKLVELKFLTRTGPNRAVAYVNDPALAHSLEVVSRNPRAFHRADRVFLQGDGQLDLGFGS